MQPMAMRPSKRESVRVSVTSTLSRIMETLLTVLGIFAASGLLSADSQERRISV